MKQDQKQRNNNSKNAPDSSRARPPLLARFETMRSILAKLSQRILKGTQPWAKWTKELVEKRLIVHSQTGIPEEWKPEIRDSTFWS